jgi:glyoxylase-like metal-dependent hydrolase (beta-lactamase superfamily II)
MIEHSEGRFIIDTGDSAENSTPGYLPWWNPFFTKQVSIRVAPHEEIGPRLCQLGLDPSKDISAVILTHYHHDHTALHHFPHTRIIAPREGWRESRGLKGKMMGCLPQRWPIWFRPELIDLDGPQQALSQFTSHYKGRKDLHSSRTRALCGALRCRRQKRGYHLPLLR